ncbi:MAG: glycyl tRNA synthetase [Candidatus Kaiserbacteria bacterium]|nr:glycyl tRNA synthetase [Candidatus Kaiserbacteria bacterium]
MAQEHEVMEKVVSLCKRRGFIYQGSEIYGGLAGTWDYGPLGTTLKKNIENLWWRMFVDSRDDMYGIDSAILMNPKVWEASGHVGGFNDPMVECANCKHRFRADHVLEAFYEKNPTVAHEQFAEDLTSLTRDFTAFAKDMVCEECGKKGSLGLPRQFNMMFKSSVGSTEGGEMPVYLRPETAQGMFVNFKNIIDSYHPKLPFGIAQIGKSFRNEIAPRDFIFRVRELEIMEFEYFISEEMWQEQFEYWRAQFHAWFKALGFASDDIQEIEVGDGDRAHYSKRTMDFYFKYPFGYKEIGGLAYRTDFDLKNHIEHSKVALEYLNPDGTKLIPHVLEPTFGLGRHILAVIAKAYTEDELGGESRIFLRFPKHLAPVKAAVFPLLKNKPELVAKAREVYVALKKEIPQIMWDDNGNIGKRYRRQDEIGTPACITIDFGTLGTEDASLKDTVTIRDRDTGEQKRVNISELTNLLK